MDIEGVGIIESIGEEVRSLKEGDAVMSHFIGECPNCISEKSNLCFKYPLSFTTGYGAALKLADIDHNSTVAVLGLGGVGLGVVEGARERGAAKIIGINIHDKKEEKGKIFGVTDFINAKNSEDKSISKMVKEATGGLGVNYFFECTDVPDLMINQERDLGQ
ncbi:PREDICTED: alcohol dehydrogenase-like 5 [Ipomoea nil]|uniref:alcohol dehydrogenase-like 5 n=1 Tax=Ipomoea nil TaxID=35883 RepID=UPI000901FAEC|nr:PREDICTED: alcohol dehydrogenase-like 5 [Ipomoea nil]